MKLRFLGTGTSNGVPVVGCNCEVCTSTEKRDKRYRSAAMLETERTRILIDCGPDIRMQLMPLEFKKIDGVLLTHVHYDHTGGLDDLRPYCAFGDIDIYANESTIGDVRHNFPYCFSENLYPGVPKFNLHTIDKHVGFQIGEVSVMPFEVMHGRLPVLGFRFGSLAYITDMKTMNEEEYACLDGVETLVVNALRWEKPHHSHLVIPESMAFARKIGAKQTYFTHLTHKIGLHDHASTLLPDGFAFAYDGLEICV